MKTNKIHTHFCCGCGKLRVCLMQHCIFQGLMERDFVCSSCRKEPDTICANCGHSKLAHWDRYGCQVEGPDRWVDWGQGDRLIAPGPCGCKDFEAEPSFASGLASLGHAFARLQALTGQHLAENKGDKL